MTIHFQAKTEQGWTVHSPLQPVVFPDGAVHIKGADTETRYQYQIADVRGLSHDDLFILSMWADACISRGEKRVLIMPYLPGARMDRGVPNLSTYTQFIADQIVPDQLIYIDAHSPEWRRSLYEFGEYEGVATEFPVERIIRREVQDASRDLPGNHDYVGVIAPDKGAHDRAAAAAKVMGVPVYTGGKTRDFETGKLSGFRMKDELPAEGKLLIVDDICDGGGTFIGLAEATGLPKERLGLWVTHGVFSKGVHVLADHFGTVHTTDSFYQGDSWKLDDVERPDKAAIDFELKVHKLAPYLYAEVNVG